MPNYMSKIVLIQNEDGIEAVRENTQELIQQAENLGFAVVGGYTKRSTDHFETLNYGERDEVLQATPQGIQQPSRATSKDDPGRK